MSNLVKKISVKTLYGKIGKIEKETPIMRVLGLASEVEVGESNYGQFTRFIGQFEATDLESGTVVTSNVLFVPSVVEILLKAGLAQSRGGVEFALDIIAVPDASSSTGYTYQARSLMPVSDADPLKKIKGLLAAPEEPKKEEPKKEEPKKAKK